RESKRGADELQHLAARGAPEHAALVRVRPHEPDVVLAAAPPHLEPASEQPPRVVGDGLASRRLELRAPRVSVRDEDDRPHPDPVYRHVADVERSDLRRRETRSAEREPRLLSAMSRRQVSGSHGAPSSPASARLKSTLQASAASSGTTPFPSIASRWLR